MKKVFLLSFIFIMILASCQPADRANTMNTKSNKIAVEETKSTYTPPANGLITDEQADRYIQVAKAFNEAILDQVEIMDDFYKKYNIAGKEEIEKLKDNKQAMDEWNNIMKTWDEKERKIYEDYKMSSDEFDWIASALIDPKNSKIQQKIAKALEDTTKEESSK